MIFKILGLTLGTILCLFSIISFLKWRSDKERMDSIILGFIGFMIIRVILKYF
mgnify:FL=1